MTLSTLKRFCKTLAFRLLVLALILYTLYHCVAAFSDRVVTDIVVSGVDRNTVSGEAILFRDETVLSVSGGGLLCSYPNENGAKVNLSTPLCQIYTTGTTGDALATAQASLRALDRQIALAEQLPTADMLAQLPKLQAQLSELALVNNRLLATGGSWQSLQDNASSLLITLNRIDALTTQSGSNATLLAAVRAERQALLSSIGRYLRTVTIAELSQDSSSGYFFYGETVDGYETIFRRSELKAMTAADFERLRNTPRVATPNGITNVGKLVTGYAWSIALPVKSEITELLEEGDSYDVTFPHEESLTLSMVLERILPAEEGGQAVLVLACNTHPRNFSYTRFAEVELTLSSAEGYRVPETALTQQNGQDGVYILDSGRVSFRAIRVLTRGEGYVIAYAPSNAERTDETDPTYHYDRYLDIRDVIITEGEDLYDGKYIE